MPPPPLRLSEKPIVVPPCKECGRTFQMRKTLNQHMKDVHGMIVHKVGNRITYRPPGPPPPKPTKAFLNVIKNIKRALSHKNEDLDVAIENLEQLQEFEIRAWTLRKHPMCVESMFEFQNFIGRDFFEDEYEAAEYQEKVTRIRQMSFVFFQQMEAALEELRLEEERTEIEEITEYKEPPEFEEAELADDIIEEVNDEDGVVEEDDNLEVGEVHYIEAVDIIDEEVVYY